MLKPHFRSGIKSNFRDMSFKPRIAVVTACGRKKESKPSLAWKLYRSPRIKMLYHHAQKFDLYILTAKYGLVKADEIIRPYDEIMDKEKAETLAPKVAKKLDPYDYVVYYKSGANQNYLDCIKMACDISKKILIICGFKVVGGINDVPLIVEHLLNNEVEQIRKIEHVQFFNFC